MDAELKNALNKVIKAPNIGFVPYARTYAEAALRNPHTGEEMEGDELKTQLLYVLRNLQYWKGYDAQVVKDVLRKHAGIKARSK